MIYQEVSRGVIIGLGGDGDDDDDGNDDDDDCRSLMK